MRIILTYITYIVSFTSFTISARCFEQQAFDIVCDSLLRCGKQNVKQEFFYSGYSTGDISSLQIIAECVGDMVFFGGDESINDSLLIDNFINKTPNLNLKTFTKDQQKVIAYHFYIFEDTSGLQLKENSLARIRCQKIPIANNSRLKVKIDGYRSKLENHYYISINNAISYNGYAYVLLRITNNYHGVEEWVVVEYGVSTKLFRKRVYICQS